MIQQWGTRRDNLISTQEKGIYPALERRGVSTRAPWRMMAGMVIASAAFAIAGLLDLRVDGGEPVNVAVSVETNTPSS